MDRKHAVLALLKARGPAALAEVADGLGISKQGALRHLDALQARGLVEVTTRGHDGPGRPHNVYALTDAASAEFPSGHRELATELVEFLDQDGLDRFFASRARRLEEEYGPRLAGLGFEARVRELARLTTERGHMTEMVERPDGGLQIRHCNCPIQDVAARDSHPCQQEQELYRRLLGAIVARSTWMADGDSSCTYDITTTERTDIG